MLNFALHLRGVVARASSTIVQMRKAYFAFPSEMAVYSQLFLGFRDT